MANKVSLVAKYLSLGDSQSKGISEFKEIVKTFKEAFSLYLLCKLVENYDKYNHFEEIKKEEFYDSNAVILFKDIAESDFGISIKLSNEEIYNISQSVKEIVKSENE